MNPCGHVFHALCIQTWLVQKPACPVCRSVVSCCQHGSLDEHEPRVLVGVIRAQQSMIDSMQTEQQIAEDSSLALRMRLEVLARDQQYYEQQFYMFQGLAIPRMTFGDH
jgi:hypothetical protein